MAKLGFKLPRPAAVLNLKATRTARGRDLRLGRLRLPLAVTCRESEARAQAAVAQTRTRTGSLSTARSPACCRRRHGRPVTVRVSRPLSLSHRDRDVTVRSACRLVLPSSSTKCPDRHWHRRVRP